MTAPPIVADAQVPLLCPRCSNADVQKVSAVVSGGAWNTAGRSIGVGAGHISGGPNFYTVNTSVSRQAGAMVIAQILAPPPHPPLAIASRRTVGFILLVFGCLMALAGIPMMFDRQITLAGAFLTLVAAGLAIPGLVCLCTAASEEARVNLENRYKTDRHHQAIAAWNQLFYCGRCDTVFNPSTRAAVPPQEMYTLL